MIEYFIGEQKQFLSQITPLIVLFPLIASLISGLGHKILPRQTVSILTIAAVGLSFFISAVILIGLFYFNVSPFTSRLYLWGSSGNIHFELGFLIDRLSALMMVVVSFVSWMVHIYTIGYMKEDPGYNRFFSYISLFTFGMLMLVMSNNFLQLFFGWEAVGLMSYLLIGFWFKRESANRASLKAFLVNRLGDMGFLVGIAGIFYYFGSLDYLTVFHKVDKFALSNPVISFFDIEVSAITFMTLCLFLGAMGKSAQMPLHVWLPDSMEGPTPISALIHAATMVTAGVFMIARLSPLFEYSDTALNVVLTIGAITALLTGILGVVQNDIKRIIAYSTLSQLGYMMTAMGVSAYSIGIFHLMTHAFFKALLFLAAGSVILCMHHEQNIWKMGNLKKYMPITYVTTLIGSLALMGFPFFSGFYSKDLIIEAVKLSTLPAAGFAYLVVVCSVFITALYTFRLFFVVFHGKERMSQEVKSHLHESPKVVWIPLVILAFFSIISGAIFVGPLFSGFFGDSLVVHANHTVIAILKSEYHNVWETTLHGFHAPAFPLGLLGILTAMICYVFFTEIPGFLSKRFSILYFILKEKYGFDAFNEWIVARGTKALAFIFWRFGDQWLIDGVGVNGTADSVGRASFLFSRLQSGYLYHYAFAMITGFLFLVIWLLVF